METENRLVHWYDTERHRNACGAAGHSNSTKHVRGVTCRACLATRTEARGAAEAARHDGLS
jgi:hypothetical protein